MPASRKYLCRSYHGDMLEIACRTCGAKAPYRLNVALLDAPYRCGSCGHLYGVPPPASLPPKRPVNKKAHRHHTAAMELFYVCLIVSI